MRVRLIFVFFGGKIFNFEMKDRRILKTFHRFSKFGSFIEKWDFLIFLVGFKDYVSNQTKEANYNPKWGTRENIKFNRV